MTGRYWTRKLRQYLLTLSKGRCSAVRVYVETRDADECINIETHWWPRIGSAIVSPHVMPEHGYPSLYEAVDAAKELRSRCAAALDLKAVP